MKMPKVGDIINWDGEAHLVLDIKPATRVTYRMWECLNLVSGKMQVFVREEFTEYDWELLA